MTTINPSADKVLVHPAKPANTTEGGIALVTSTPEQTQEGTVVAVGPGRVLESGQQVPVPFAVGDTVLFALYGGVPLKVDGEPHILLESSGILATKVISTDETEDTGTQSEA